MKGEIRNVLVIGDNEKVRTMIKLLSTDSKYKTVVIVGESDGAKVFNIPVVKTDDYKKTIGKHKANCVIFANRIMDDEKLKELNSTALRRRVHRLFRSLGKVPADDSVAHIDQVVLPGIGLGVLL